MSYITHSDEDIRAMLDAIGVKSLQDLFNDIPASLRIETPLPLPAALSGMEADRLMKSLAAENTVALSFVGAGAYPHYIPPVVDHLAGRSEFYTAYTPYQPEVSQGTLAAIFEFQTMICRLTGMDIANASMYDGATATAESALLAIRSATGRNRVLVSRGVHPSYRAVLGTYAWAAGIELVDIELDGGATAAPLLAEALDERAAAVVVQSPNFLGVIEELGVLFAAARGAGASSIAVVTEPMSLALLAPPGAQGADIVCGEARSFGNPLGFGGPALGFLAVREPFLRKIPGRLVGKTVDLDGNEAFVLTLQTREQHIRRERATSNICTNEGLCALRAVIYLSLYGAVLPRIASYNHAIAGALKRALEERGFEPLFRKPYFNEFVMRHPRARERAAGLCASGVVPGLALGDYAKEMRDCLLLCATESHTEADIERFMRLLDETR